MHRDKLSFTLESLPQWLPSPFNKHKYHTGLQYAGMSMEECCIFVFPLLSVKKKIENLQESYEELCKWEQSGNPTVDSPN
jgi:hypothetical protein